MKLLRSVGNKEDDGPYPEKRNKEQCVAFDYFVERSSNMPCIWEKIMNNLSGTDVANCLKVCKSLRYIIGQSLETSSKFRNMMDISATVSAMHRGRITCSDKFSFSDIENCTVLYALDDHWYHYRDTSSCLLNMNPNCQDQNQTYNDFPLVPTVNVRISSQTRHAIVIHPTLNPNLVLFQNQSCPSLFELGLDPTEPLHNFNFHGASKGNMTELRSSAATPRCLQYRLYFHKDPVGEENALIMNLLDDTSSDKCAVKDRTVVLCKFKNELGPVIHTASNEQAKFMLIQNHTLSVNDVRNGAVLWQTSLCPFENEFRSNANSRFESLFITRVITGYLQILETSTHGTKYEFKIFDTGTGEFICSYETANTIPISNDGRKIMVARGPYLCYAWRDIIHVIKICNKKVKKYEFAFPVDYFARALCKSITKQGQSRLRCSLIDFVGRSNVLVGNLVVPFHFISSHFLPIITEPVLFNLDLDAATSALNDEEIKMSFSVTLACKTQESCGISHDLYKPVYKTDRTNKCVDVVGVTRKKQEPDGATEVIESYFFVTVMQCSTDLLYDN